MRPLAAGLLLSLIFGSAVPPFADAADETPAAAAERESLYGSDAEAAVQRGLRYLHATQNTDGSWGQMYKVACTAKSGLAFLACGNSTTRGEYAKTLKKAVLFLIDNQQTNGYFDDQCSRMHGQGYATMFLAQVYGMSNSGSPKKPDELTGRIKKSLDLAVALIVQSQAKEGGWWYDPSKNGSDQHEGSITVGCVEGLRAARDAGIQVPRASIELAVDYMKKSYGDGSFAYQLGQPPQGSYALSAAGACVLIATGDASDTVQRMINECLNYMARFTPGEGSDMFTPYYFYAHFYAAQAFHFRGGREWARWYKCAKRDLLTRQVTDKESRQTHWVSPSDEADNDVAFSTAIAILILQMPNEYLPLFQR